MGRTFSGGGGFPGGRRAARGGRSAAWLGAFDAAHPGAATSARADRGARTAARAAAARSVLTMVMAEKRYVAERSGNVLAAVKSAGLHLYNARGQGGSTHTVPCARGGWQGQRLGARAGWVPGAEIFLRVAPIFRVSRPLAEFRVHLPLAADIVYILSCRLLTGDGPKNR